MITRVKKTLSSGRVAPIQAGTLTRHYWEALGWRVAFVERFVRRGSFSRKYDCWGFADYLAFFPGRVGILALQACAWSGLAAHRTKILELPQAYEYLTCEGNRICIMGWRYHKQKGKPPVRKTVFVTTGDFDLQTGVNP